MAAQLQTAAQLTNAYTSRTHGAATGVVTCPLDDLHHVGGEVAHTVVASAVVVNAAFPSAVRVLLQNLSHTQIYLKLAISCIVFV